MRGLESDVFMHACRAFLNQAVMSASFPAETYASMRMPPPQSLSPPLFRLFPHSLFLCIVLITVNIFISHPWLLHEGEALYVETKHLSRAPTYT